MALLVVALGGHALVPRGQEPTVAVQRRAAAAAARSLAEVVRGHEIVVTHGSGPQVGLLALQGEALPATRAPLDVLDAQTQGLIGYVLEQALANELPDRLVATVLTRVVVAGDDPAFDRPSKPIGPTYDEAEARRLATERGWVVAPDGGGWRRVVPSPEPRRIVQLPVVRLLLGAGMIPICTGGGGIPVVEGPRGTTTGVEAVIDKDLASALLAIDLGADALLLLTDVPQVIEGWGTPLARPLARVRPAELRALRLPGGSMGPKAEAACRFVERGGGWAAIGRLDQVADVIAGTAGTRVAG